MELYPVVAGDLSGSMDRTVFYKVDDRCLGRKKAMPKERDFSDVEKEQHLKFGFTGKLGSRLRYVLKETLLHVPKYLSAANYFVRLNIGNCMVEDLDSGLVTFDYEHAVFAEGSLIVPNVEASYLEESNSFSFTLTPIEGREFPGKLSRTRCMWFLWRATCCRLTSWSWARAERRLPSRRCWSRVGIRTTSICMHTPLIRMERIRPRLCIFLWYKEKAGRKSGAGVPGSAPVFIFGEDFWERWRRLKVFRIFAGI